VPDLPDVQTGFVELNGANIYYEVAGDGPPLVLLHAGIADARMWDDQFAVFAQQYRVIRYDMRGYGKTAMVDGSYAHRQWDQMESAWNKGNYARVSELEVQMWVDGPYRAPDQVNADLRAKVREMNLIALQNEALELGQAQPLEPPAAGRLDEIRVPALLIVGDLDRPVMYSAANFMETHIARAQKVVMAGTAHLPNMEQPNRFNQLVLDFLQALKSS
jgi:pimeloyl-ACP methyl ester carboxylesterase